MNVLENVCVFDVLNGSVNVKIMVDVLVAYDKMMVKRIVEILTSENVEDKFVNLNVVVSIGLVMGYDVLGCLGEVV